VAPAILPALGSLDAQEVCMAKRNKGKAGNQKKEKDLVARGKKAAGVKGGATSLTAPAITKEEFQAQFRGGTATPPAPATAPSTSRSPSALSS
jgi:hypothetical protein